MTSRIRIAMFMALAAPRLVAAADVDRPCKVTDSVIESNRSVLVRCDQANPNLPEAAELYAVDDAPTGDPTIKVTKIADLDIATVMSRDGVVPQWRRFSIRASSAAVLTSPIRYFLHIRGTLPPASSPGDTWKPFWFSVPTTGLDVAVLDAGASIDSGKRLRLRAKIALNPPSGTTVCIVREGKCDRLPAVFTVSAPAPVAAVTDPANVGNADILITGRRLRLGKLKLQIGDLTDVLGRAVALDAKSRTEIFGRRLSGKVKDEVGTYLKFGHEAADLKRPAWTLDAKGQVELGRRVRGWRMIPNATADIGFGSAKTTNAITIGTSFTRYDLIGGDFENPRQTTERGARERRLLQGMRLAVAPTLETDRRFDKRNLVTDIDAELFFRGLYNSIATQNRRRLNAKRLSTPGAEMDDIAGSRFGWVISIKGGLEAGGALYDQQKTFDIGAGDAKTSTTVEASAHGIARVRAKVSTLLEFSKRVSLNVQGTGRWLGATERSLLADGPIFVLQDFDGVRGYADLTVSIAVTDTVALDSTYKVGRQPPLFQSVSTVQTGVAFRF